MNKELELEYYLNISPSKFGIYLFDKNNLRNLYKDELTVNGNKKFLNLSDLKKFLDKSVFKIEKLSGKFVENICLIFEDDKIFNLEIGIKKKNYNTTVTKEHLKNLLVEVKDLFRESHQNHIIMHMIINKYFFNDKLHDSFMEDLNCDQIALEVQFKFITKSMIYDLNKI